MLKHGLGFHLNAGGGEFKHEKFGICRMIGNYRDDHDTLLNWLKKNGL